MRWKDVFEGTTRDFHSPSHSFFLLLFGNNSCFSQAKLAENVREEPEEPGSPSSQDTHQGSALHTHTHLPAKPGPEATEPGGFIPDRREEAFSQRLATTFLRNFLKKVTLPPRWLQPRGRGGQAVGLRGGTPARRGAGDQLLSTHLLVLAGSSEPRAVLAVRASVLEHGPGRGSSLGTGRNN